MTEIPLYNSFFKIESITKGMSGDKKYYIETVDGKHMLLRIADVSEYSQKRTEFQTMKHLAHLVCQCPHRLILVLVIMVNVYTRY